MRELPPLNRRYEIVPLEEQAFIIEISGVLDGLVPMESATQKIEDTLQLYYGKDSLGPNNNGRREQVQIRELYDIMNGLKIFSVEEDIEISVVGNTKPEKLSQMLYVNLDESIKRLDLSY